MTQNGNGNGGNGKGDQHPLARIQNGKLNRLRAIEELYLNGYCAREIHQLLEPTYGVTYGTIRNDIVLLRRVWKYDTSHEETVEGKERYMASLRSMRRRVMKGWREKDVTGRERIVGRDYKLAHSIDKEIAKLSGVAVASEGHSIHITIQAAREFMDRVMGVVMTHVTDAETQSAIIRDIERLEHEQPAGP